MPGKHRKNKTDKSDNVSADEEYQQIRQMSVEELEEKNARLLADQQFTKDNPPKSGSFE